MKSETSERENNPDVARQYSLESQITLNEMQIKNNIKSLSDNVDELILNEIKTESLDEQIKKLDDDIAKPKEIKFADYTTVSFLDDPEGRVLLKNHMDKEQTLVDFDFLVAVDTFKKEAPNLSDDQLLQAAKEINTKYILEDSQTPMNLAFKVRTDATAKLQNSEIKNERVDANVFDVASRAVGLATTNNAVARLKGDTPDFEPWAQNRLNQSLETQKEVLIAERKEVTKEFEALKTEKKSLSAQNEELEKKNELLKSQSSIVGVEIQLKADIRQLDKKIEKIDIELDAGKATLESMLSDPAMLKTLRLKAKEKGQLELVDFLVVMNEYEQASIDQDADSLSQMAENIRNEYIKEGAPSEINVNSVLRLEVEANFKAENVNPRIFDKYRDAVPRLINQNQIPQKLSNEPKFKELHQESKIALGKEKNALVKEREELMNAYLAARLTAVEAERSQTS